MTWSIHLKLLTACQLGTYENNSTIQIINTKKGKNLHNAEISSYMNCMGKAIDPVSSRYQDFLQDFLLIEDFNAEISDISIEDFCNIYSFNPLVPGVH